jgi:competence protein ComEA
VPTWSELNPRNAIAVILVAVLTAAGVYFAFERNDGPEPLEIRPADATPAAIEVYITGAVAQPGVYEMRDGDRVIDLLQKAGGFAEDADPEAIGLAKRLHDEDTVQVPRAAQAANGSSQVAGTTTGTTATGIVNINTATQDELIALPGIGEAYSQRIIDSRATDGPFARTDELLARAVIPQHTFDEIKDLITAQ